MNLLLINNDIKDISTFIKSINSNTKYVIYDNFNEIIQKIKILNIKTLVHVGFVFEYIYDNKVNFNDIELIIIYLTKTYNLLTIDFLTCNLLLYPEWLSFFENMMKTHKIIIRASNNATGNLANGGDFILENSKSTNKNIQNLYFTDDIKYWTFTLGTTAHVIGAITLNDTVKTCGSNMYGQLGNDSLNSSTIFVDVLDSTPFHNIFNNVLAIETGSNHTIFLVNNGQCYGCGRNYEGQLGLGVFGGIYKTPELITSINNIKQIACGMHFTLFLDNNSMVYGTGSNLLYQLNNGNNFDQPAPISMGLTNVREITCCEYTSIILYNNGIVWGIGGNNFGQLGQGDIINRTSLVQIYNGSPSPAISVSSGNFHLCILCQNGNVLTCGYNINGQLGIGNYISPQMSLQSVLISNCISVSCGPYHTVFLLSDFTINITGDNGNGQTGHSIQVNTPTDPDSILYQPYKIIDIRTLAFTTYYLTDTGLVFGSGNVDGVLGTGSTDILNNFREILTDIKSISNRDFSGDTFSTVTSGDIMSPSTWGSTVAPRYYDRIVLNHDVVTLSYLCVRQIIITTEVIISYFFPSTHGTIETPINNGNVILNIPILASTLIYIDDYIMNKIILGTGCTIYYTKIPNNIISSTDTNSSPVVLFNAIVPFDCPVY